MGATRNDVLLFLLLVKQCAAREFILWRRRENLETLARLGITIREAKERVLALTPEDYYRGPSKRHGHPDQQVCEFGLEVGGTEVYVKVNVIVEPEQCVCMSFHLAERPLSYPLRQARDR